MQNQEQVGREKQSDLKEIHYSFQEQGKRLEDCLSRLTAIGNTLSDDSDSLTAKSPVPEPQSRMPGVVRDLSNCAIGFGDLINRIQTQISKIEQFV